MTSAVATFQARLLLRGRASTASLVLFAAAAGLAAAVGLGSFRQVGLGAVGPAAAALVNLALLLPTAQAILLGALTVTDDRESGFRAVLLARGVGSGTIIATTWLAVTLATWLSLLAGFGLAALILGGNVPPEDLVVFAALLGVALAVAAAAAAVGVVVGSVAATRVQAALGGVAAWFALAIGFDLAIIGLGAFLRFGEAAVLVAILADPLTSGRVAALLLLDAAGGVVGPTGLYLIERVGREGSIAVLLAVVVAWTAVPLLVATAAVDRRES